MDEPVQPQARVRTRRKKVLYPHEVKARKSLVVDPMNPMPKGHQGLGPRLSKETKEAALETMIRQIERGRGPTQAVRALATRYGCHEAAMWRLLGPYRRSTTKAATWHLRASAYAMAQRITEEGSPAELIDVLSRPNIGALDPVKKVGGDAGAGLFISVQIGSCGGVTPTITAPRGEITDGHILNEGTGQEESGENAAWGGSTGEPEIAR